MKTWLVCFALVMASDVLANCEDPIAELHFTLSNGQRSEFSQVEVKREGDAVVVHDVLPLCEADIVRTLEDGRALLRLGPAGGKQFDLTLEERTAVQVVHVNTVQLFLGAMFADLEDRFDVVMPFGLLGATGTAYRLDVTDSGFSVDQIEGRTKFQSDDLAAQEINPSRRYTLQGQTGNIGDLAQDQCRRLVRDNSRFLLAGQAGEPTALPTDIDRSLLDVEKYSNAREQVLCATDSQSRLLLGRVAVAMGRPDRGLEHLQLSQGGVETQISIARARMQRGEPDQALTAYQAAQAASATSLSAQLGIGDALRDLGLAADDETQTKRHFARAERAYIAGLVQLARTDQERSAAQIKLGDLRVLQASLVDPAQAELGLNRAVGHFRRAQALSDLPHAALGLAQVELVRAQLMPTQVMERGDLGTLKWAAINVALGMLAERQRKPLREQARDMLRQLRDDHPQFAPALLALGRVEGMLGNRERARSILLNAMSADPDYRPVLGAYEQVAPSGQRDLYREAYKSFEYRPARKIQQRRQELMIPDEASESIPVTPLTADVSRLTFAKTPQTLKVTWTNRGERASEMDEAHVSGGDAVFQVTANSCSGQSISPNRTCVLDITFDRGQSAATDFTGALRVTGDGGQWQRDIQLTASLAGAGPIQ